jgi:hypothetical protein
LPFGQWEIGVEERAAPTQVLREAASVTVVTHKADGDWEMKVETLCRSALEMNLVAHHSFSQGWRSAPLSRHPLAG